MKFKKNPDEGKCFEGELAAETKTNVLDFLNFIRELHGLKPVVYSAKDDIAVQKGAFILAVNGGLTHDPPKNWRCWSKEGYSGCSTSNIIGGTDAPFTPCEAVRYWLIDAGVEGLGHRRWLLNPFQKTIAYGHVVCSGRHGAAIKVIGNEEQAATVDFVAYPFHEYPAVLVDMNWYLSFTVVQDRKDIWKNGSVDFSSAAVTVTSESGKRLTVTSVMHDNQGYGVPNLLAWKLKGLEKGIRYTVSVRNVKTSTGKRNYEYWFMLK